MSEAEQVANELARLLAEEHQHVTSERAKRRAAEQTASQLAVQLVHERAELERERTAREQAEAQAQELSTLVLGDAPREPTRFVPARRGLQRVS
jgi:hypothetical protein